MKLEDPMTVCKTCWLETIQVQPVFHAEFNSLILMENADLDVGFMVYSISSNWTSPPGHWNEASYEVSLRETLNE